MNFDSAYFGPQAFTEEDREYDGSRFAEVRESLMRNAYYLTWGADGEPPLPIYGTNLKRLLSGILPGPPRWRFLDASRRTIQSQADMRWGDGRGFRRLLHPNGVCLFGTWEIFDEATNNYSGYFRPGSRSLIVARYSTGIGIRRGDYRTLSMVGKLYPTTDQEHREPLKTANFITQEEFGGARTSFVNDAVLHNAPNTTPWRRLLVDVPLLLLTGFTLFLADSQPTIRQLYPIAELGKPDGEPTRAPEFMRLRVDSAQPRIEGERLDFRDEILGQVYDKGVPNSARSLIFNIDVSDEGHTTGLLVQRRHIRNWRHIGRIVFDEAVASYNGDFVVHFHHAAWRRDRNQPESVVRKANQTA
ncbi:MAG: hypothetical protein AAFU85_02600 [Planctomycetota bacterium]